MFGSHKRFLCFSFITWLAVKNKLYTGNRKWTWGVFNKVVYCVKKRQNKRPSFLCLPLYFYCLFIYFLCKKRWFHLFAGNPSIVNSPSHCELNPGGGSYNHNPFATRPTQRWLLLLFEKRLSSRLCGRWIDLDWNETLEFVTHNLNPMDHIMMCMVFQNCVYHMWKERNTRKHQTGLHTLEQAIQLIDKSKG